MTRLLISCLCLAFGLTQSIIAEFSFTTFPSPTIKDTWATNYDSLILRGIASNVGSHHSCIWKINGSDGTIFSKGCRESNTRPSFVKQWNCSYDSITKVMISNLHFIPLNATLAVKLQCQDDKVSQMIMVLNQNCSSDIQSGNESAKPSMPCDFGCTAKFACPTPTYESGNFNATCEANAQWNVSALSFCIPETKCDNTAVIVGVVVLFSIIGLGVGGFFLYRWKFKDNGFIPGKPSS